MTRLEAGDVVWVEFDPAFGHEQKGRRPALILSDGAYNSRSSFVLACPVTRSRTPWPFHAPLPAGGTVVGAVVVDQIKSIDKRRIVSPPIDRIDAALLMRIRSILATLVGLDPSQF